MAKLAESPAFDEKLVTQNSLGTIEIHHGDDYVVLDRFQAEQLVPMLISFIETGGVAN